MEQCITQFAETLDKQTLIDVCTWVQGEYVHGSIPLAVILGLWLAVSSALHFIR